MPNIIIIIDNSGQFRENHAEDPMCANNQATAFRFKARTLVPGFLALLLLTPLAAQAQFTFVTNNGAITITRYTGFGAPVAVVIPDTTNGYPVTTIGTRAFLNSSNVTSVTIPNSVTTLASNAFNNCFRLTNVTIGNGVTSIGDQAFNNCNLRSVTIPNSVTSIGNLPFYGSSGLTNISVAADNPSYSSANGVLFDKTQGMLIQFPEGQGGNYTIPGSVTSIGNYAFYNCRRVTSVTIPNSVTSIGPQAFWYCTSLTSISVAADNPSYSSANGVLFDKTQATLIRFPEAQAGSYIIPNSVTGIGFGAFFDCRGLTGTTIPNSVTSIGDYAFQYFWNLTSVTVPNSVTSIGDWAFSYCPLTNITCKGDAPALGGDNVFANVNPAAKVYYFPGTSGWGPTYGGLPTVRVEDFTYATNGGALTITAYTGPAGAVVIPAMTNGYPVISIGGNAFYGRTDVTSVTIPNSVTTIESAAFAYCSGLTSVTIGNGVTTIEGSAFTRSGLTSVTIPNSVRTIGASAFAYCSDLTRVTIPSSVTYIGDAAFQWCVSLTNATIIGNSLSSIGSRMFYNCALNSVTIPSSVTGIGNEAFAHSSLRTVTIPNNVTTIGEGAFSHCFSLTNATIGNSVTIIAHGVFGFTGITSLTIPSSVTTIQGAPFRYCSSLTNINVAASNPSYSSVNGVLFNKSQAVLIQYPGGRAGSYTVPNGVGTIADGAFLDCRRLTSVTIPNSVFSIEGFAFYYCEGLTSVTIGTSVPHIADQAFAYCFRLTNITCLGNAPTLGADVFAYVNGSAKVYYFPGTSGWGPTYDGLPTVMIFARFVPGSAGKKPGGFGFTINGGPDQTIVLEASTNLVNWQPIRTNTLFGIGSADFVDPQSVNHPRRFYRARSN